MAKAEITTVTKTVETEVQEKAYTLTLNEEEAMLLRALVGNVRGSEFSTYNKYGLSIWSALYNVGVPGVVHSTRFTITNSNVIAAAL